MEYYDRNKQSIEKNTDELVDNRHVQSSKTYFMNNESQQSSSNDGVPKPDIPGCPLLFKPA